MLKLNKSWLVLVLLVAVGVMAVGEADAQTTSRANLISNLWFYYIEKPNDSTVSATLLNNAAIGNGIESGAFWTDPDMSTARELVRALLKRNSQGGDVTLQHYADEVVHIMNKPVGVWMYDDVSTAINAEGKATYNPCLDDASRVWPCAWHEGSQNWAGHMHLGAFNMNGYGASWTKATFLHELVHTQDQADSRGHIFYVHGVDYSYGIDQDHYSYEAIPNMAYAYSEGIANTISYLYDGKEAQRAFKWFSNNDDLWVEHARPAGISSSDWLYDRIEAATGVAGQVATDPRYRTYKVRNVPAWFIVHNEQIQALIFSEYVRHIKFTTFMDALGTSNYQLFKVCASGIAILFENMCKAGLPDNQNLDQLLRASYPGPKKYLLPLAYADYFTAYKAVNETQFAEIFENALPMDWIRLYFTSGRNAVHQAVPMTATTTPKWADLTSIAVALGITQSGP